MLLKVCSYTLRRTVIICDGNGCHARVDCKSVVIGGENDHETFSVWFVEKVVNQINVVARHTTSDTTIDCQVGGAGSPLYGGRGGGGEGEGREKNGVRALYVGN